MSRPAHGIVTFLEVPQPPSDRTVCLYQSHDDQETPKPDESKNRFALAVEIFNRSLHDCLTINSLPNAYVEVTCKNYSRISSVDLWN